MSVISIQTYAGAIKEIFAKESATLVFEPGRWLVANAGVIVTQIIRIKKTSNKTFVIVDSAMNDFMRPTLYEAYHDIIPLKVSYEDVVSVVDVVGPVCETGDYFGLNRAMPAVREKDFLAIMTTGAYGAVLAGTYNARPLISEVLVNEDKFAIITEKPSYEKMIEDQKIAFWL